VAGEEEEEEFLIAARCALDFVYNKRRNT
jgi:hypothetical protein